MGVNHYRKMKKIIYTIIIIATILTAACLFAGYELVCIATVPTDNYGQNYDTAYAMVYEKYPELRNWHDSLVERGLWRDTFLTNDEGLRLHGIIIEHAQTDSTQPVGTMMMIHGYCDDAPVMMRYAYCDYEVLHQNVLLPERQWCGKSQGDHITFGWRDRLDMHLWLALVHRLWHQPVVVHGLSMGAATTMMLSGDDLADSLQVVGFVEDCGYSSTWDQLEFQLDKEYGLPAFPLLYSASLVNKVWHGWWLSDGDAVAQVSKCRKPMLFIHGTADDFVPFQMVHKLYAAHHGKKYLWEVPDTRHARSIHKHWNEYCEHLQSFLQSLKDED